MNYRDHSITPALRAVSLSVINFQYTRLQPAVLSCLLLYYRDLGASHQQSAVTTAAIFLSLGAPSNTRDLTTTTRQSYSTDFLRQISSNQPPSSEQLGHNLSARRKYHPAYLSHTMGVLFYNSRMPDSTNLPTHVDQPVTKPASNLLSTLPEELKTRILHLVRLTRGVR